MLPELKLKNIDSKNIGIGIALWKRFIFSEGDTVFFISVPDPDSGFFAAPDPGF